MKNHIGLSPKVRAKVGRILNSALADAHRIAAATRDYHWNVTGLQFRSLHKLFEEEYNKIAAQIDEIAERARAIGVPAEGGWKELTAAARLAAKPGLKLTAPEMIAELLDLHEKMCVQMRDDAATCGDKLGDLGTADFLTKVLEFHETTAWMLRSLLEKRAEDEI